MALFIVCSPFFTHYRLLTTHFSPFTKSPAQKKPILRSAFTVGFGGCYHLSTSSEAVVDAAAASVMGVAATATGAATTSSVSVSAAT